MGDGDSKRYLCDQHGGHCKSIEYLEKGQDNIKNELYNKTNEIKDARRSMTHDLERFEDHVKNIFVTKAEFEPIKKLVYGVAGLMIAEVIRRMLL